MSPALPLLELLSQPLALKFGVNSKSFKSDPHARNGPAFSGEPTNQFHTLGLLSIFTRLSCRSGPVDHPLQVQHLG